MIIERTIMTNDIKIIEMEFTDDIHITENSQYNKLNAANVTVYKGVHARLYGHISHKLIIRKDAIVYLHGSAAQIDNQGGELHIF